MIDYVSDFGLLNSLFSIVWISMIPTFGWSLECLIYHVNAWSYSTLTSVSFLILQSMMPCASHAALTTNQNWSGSSFPTPLNTSSLIRLVILNCGGGRGGVGGDGGEGGETSGSVGGGGKCKIRFSKKPSRALPHSPVRMKLRDYFLILYYFHFCRSSRST